MVSRPSIISMFDLKTKASIGSLIVFLVTSEVIITIKDTTNLQIQLISVNALATL